MEKRRLISKLAGRTDKDLRDYFKGCFTLDTLPLAYNLSDLNKPNIFFVDTDDYFVCIFTSSTQCIIIDGCSINSDAAEVTEFIDMIRDNSPITKLPFKLITKQCSFQFCLLFCVGLVKQFSIQNIITRFGFERNNLTRNAELVTTWFNNRYKNY